MREPQHPTPDDEQVNDVRPGSEDERPDPPREEGREDPMTLADEERVNPFADADEGPLESHHDPDTGLPPEWHALR